MEYLRRFMIPTFLALTASGHALEPLTYQNPGLTVDLGVGLWAWPVPCDADGDGDHDLIVSCPDKPSNGVWLFENTTGETAKNKFPVFRPARRLSGTVHYVMPSWTEGKLRVLSPGWKYPDFTRSITLTKTKLPVDPKFHQPQGTARGGPRVRHNQWRYADYEGDGLQDLVAGIEDWSHYGWDNAWNGQGVWQNGPLHGFVYWFRNTGDGSWGDPVKVEAGGKPVDTFGCPSPNFGDFDGNGVPDFLGGAEDGRFYFLKNPR